MHQAPTVSRPSWMVALSGGNSGRRRSPVEILATAATYVKFGPDNFHPSQDGYRDWARALLTAIPGGTELTRV